MGANYYYQNDQESKILLLTCIGLIHRIVYSENSHLNIYFYKEQVELKCYTSPSMYRLGILTVDQRMTKLKNEINQNDQLYINIDMIKCSFVNSG